MIWPRPNHWSRPDRWYLSDEWRPHHLVPNSRTSWGQPHASASLPAHILAASSLATSTTVSPPSHSLVSAYGPSVNSNVPLVASALKTGPFSSRPPANT